MKENHEEMNKIIKHLEEKGIQVEKTKSRNDVCKALSLQPTPSVKLVLK